MNKNFGYVRVSSTSQNESRQMRSIMRQGVKKCDIYVDKLTGKNTDRVELQFMLSHLRENDVLYVHSIDRLARSLRDLIKIVDEIVENGATVIFIKQNLTFSKNHDEPVSKMMLGLLGVVAEFELTLIRERSAEGIRIAQENGKYKGKKRSIEKKLIRAMTKRIERGDSVASVCREMKICRSTYYKYRYE